MVVNLIQFGVDNLDYNTLSNSKRFFVKGFNEFHGLDEDNETGDTQEILVYAIAKSLVSKKERVCLFYDFIFLFYLIKFTIFPNFL